MRPPITVTNLDKNGKVTDNWHLRIGKRWKTFTQAEWAKSGLAYIDAQLQRAR